MLATFPCCSEDQGRCPCESLRALTMLWGLVPTSGSPGVSRVALTGEYSKHLLAFHLPAKVCPAVMAQFCVTSFPQKGVCL